MKTPDHLPLLASALVLAFGISAAPAEEKPAPQAISPGAACADGQCAYLGVVTKRLPRILAEHLGIAPGTGLSIEMVQQDSPADKAGLKRDDVLTRYDDQKLMLPEQLSTLVQGSKPGQAVKIEVLRDNKPMTVEANLSVRPPNLTRSIPPAEGEDNLSTPFPGQPGFDELDAMLGGMLPGGNMAGMEQHLQRMRRHMEKMQQQMLQGQAQGGVQMQVFRLDQGRVQIHDGQGSITIEKKNGKLTLTAKDKDGKLLFEGPYDTQEDKARAPEDIRKRADRFKFEAGGMGLPGANLPPEPEIEGNVKPGDHVD